MAIRLAEQHEALFTLGMPRVVGDAAERIAEDRLLAARQRASPCPGQFLTRDMVIEARRAAGSLSPTYRGRMMRTRSD
jgi:hypothetical protein